MRENRLYQIEIRLLNCLNPPGIQQCFQVSADYTFLAFEVAVEGCPADRGLLADLADGYFVKIIALHQFQ